MWRRRPRGGEGFLRELIVRNAGAGAEIMLRDHLARLSRLIVGHHEAKPAEGVRDQGYIAPKW